MKLILAEKPSLGRNIVAGISETMVKKDGYYEGSNYIVSWLFGHLFSLEDIEHYSPSSSGKWTMENIPCFPDKFDFSLKKEKDGSVEKGVKKQFEIIRYLCNRPDIDAIINAGDADREGEIIVRICVSHCLTSPKKMLRLWLTDQTPETVAAELKNPRDDTDYDNLASEGLARTYTDWLYGVNLTRYATLRSGRLLRVGRVIVPIVRAIYERDLSIENFKPEKYYIAASAAETKGCKIELNGKEHFPENGISDCKALCAKYNAAGAAVTSVKRKKTTVPPGKLFSLSTLQSLLGKKYKMSMTESLDIIQGLYEKGFLTYPRTNSEYLATAEKDKISGIVSNIKKLGYNVVFKDKKTIFDDSKIESHSALTPTGKIPSKGQLTERETQVYSTVFRRFAAVFCAEDCIADKTEIKISVGDYEEFTINGSVIVQEGWTKYDDFSQKDKILPALSKGDRVNVDFEPAEKTTTPPKHYTIETLNNYLKNPFKDDKKAETPDGDDTEDYKAIFEGLELGTEATRTGIIGNAISSGYIQLKNNTYYLLPGGKNLIETLELLAISMDKYKTAEIGKVLKRIFRGTSEITEAVELAKKEITEAFAGKDCADIGYARQPVGVCPVCGKKVVRTSFGYGCEGYREGCKFAVNYRICSKVMTVPIVSELLSKKETEKLTGFVSPRTGKTFDGKLRLENNGKISFVF